MILCYRSKGTFTNLKLGFASTQLLLIVTGSPVKGFPFKTVRKREANVTTLAKKTNVTQTSLFPCPTDPVPGAQIVGTAKCEQNRKGGGWGRGWERAREPVPSSLPPYFFPLSYFAPHSTSERLEQAVSQKENRRSLYAHAV